MLQWYWQRSVCTPLSAWSCRTYQLYSFILVENCNGLSNIPQELLHGSWWRSSLFKLLITPVGGWVWMHSFSGQQIEASYDGSGFISLPSAQHVLLPAVAAEQSWNCAASLRRPLAPYEMCFNLLRRLGVRTHAFSLVNAHSNGKSPDVT